MRPVLRLRFVTLSAALLAHSAALAQLPSPRLDSAFPPGGQLGTEVEVALSGSDLADVASLVFDAPGLIAAKGEGQNFRVTIAPDCARGVHELRAIGRFGISTPRLFVVGDAPAILDPGSNHTPETAAAIAVPSVVFGRMDTDQRDVFRFSAQRGQTVHLACTALALDSPADPVLTISDAAGHTLARADDERDRDAQLDFVAPADGDYLLAVHDKLFAGSAAHIYRLTLLAQPEAIPPQQPANAAKIGAGNEIAETEPNDTAATAQVVALPADIRAVFDRDWFEFRAEAGRALWLEICAARDGVPCDPMLVVQKVTRDAAGKETMKQVAELDDQPDAPAPPAWLIGSRDPAGKWTPDETAAYRIRVADRFGKHGSYRLIIRDVAPDFAPAALASSPANEEKKLFIWQPNLRRGGSAAFPVAAGRRGYDGEIVLRAEALPAGVTASGVIPAGAPTGWLVFHAAPDAAAWGGLPRVIGEGGGIRRELPGLTYRWSVENRDNQRLDTRLCRLAVGVCEEPAPLVITAAEQKTWTAILGETLEIPLAISRSGQPKGEWQLAPVAFPGLAKFEPVKFDGAAATTAKLVLPLQNKDGNNFVPGTYTFFLRASGTVATTADEKAAPKDWKHVEFSAPISVTLSPAPAPPAK